MRSEDRLGELVRLAAYVAGTSAAAVVVADGTAYQVVTAHNLRGAMSPPASSIAHLFECVRTAGFVAIEEPSRAPQFHDLNAFYGSGVGFVAAVALPPTDGEPPGLLCLFDEESKTISTTQVDFLTSLTHQLSSVLEATRRETIASRLGAQLGDTLALTEVVMWYQRPSDTEPIVIGAIDPLFRLAPGTFRSEHRTLREFFHPDDLPNLEAIYAQLLVSGGTLERQSRIIRSDGSVGHVRLRAKIEPQAPTGYVVVGAIIDISAVHEQAAQLAQVYERTHDVVAAFDRELRVTYLNARAVADSQRAPDALLGKTLPELFGPDTPQVVSDALATSLREQRPIRLEAFFGPVSRWYAFRFYPAEDGVTLFGTDMTAEKKAEDEQQRLLGELRALARRVEDVREEESQRIARELHDELGQALTIIKLDATALRRKLEHDAPALIPKVTNIITLVDEMSGLARRIATELRPQLLDDLGLAAAVESLARQFAKRTGIACHVETPEETKHVPRPVALVLFRVLQEMLTNVARHASAQTVVISLEAGDEGLVLSVDDDGVGIGPSPARGLGVLGMRERLARLGGTLIIGPRDHGGTHVAAHVPHDALDGR